MRINRVSLTQRHQIHHVCCRYASCHRRTRPLRLGHYSAPRYPSSGGPRSRNPYPPGAHSTEIKLRLLRNRRQSGRTSIWTLSPIPRSNLPSGASHKARALSSMSEGKPRRRLLGEVRKLWPWPQFLALPQSEAPAAD